MKRYAVDALTLLSALIKSRRIEANMTEMELSTRAGISIETLEQIEHADPNCPIGSYFAVAENLKIHLFEDDQTKLTWRLFSVQEKLALLPKIEKQMSEPFTDDF
jgi:transcriptional regulator with XRE-family HTH domain